MVNKYLECLSVEGNYSKARIGCLLMAIFSIAVFIWLVVLTAQISNAKKGEDDNEPKLECMTKDKKKCVFPFLDGDSQHDKCEWKDKKFECATEVNKDNKPASVGDCLYQCELKVEGYTQKFLYDGKKLLSCSNKQHIKINPKLDTMGCKDLCDKEKDCKFFYTTDSKYCVTYKSCDEHRTVTGRAGTTFQKIEDGTTAAPTDAPTAAPTDATTAAPTDAPTAAPTDAPTTPSDPVNPTVPTPTVEPTKEPVTTTASITTTITTPAKPPAPKGNWIGPLKKIWNNFKICPKAGFKFQKNLDQCKKSCLEKKGCTAINFQPGLVCVLLACTQPVPAPTDQENGFVGYYLT